MKQYPNAAEGLRLMFIGQILVIVGTLLIWVPFVGSLIVIAGTVAGLLGIYKAGADDENYRGALVFQVISLVVGVVNGFLGDGILSSLLGIVSMVLSLLVVYTVCNTTSNLLHSLGNEPLAERGQTVIKLYMACTAVSIVCQVLGIVPILNIIAGLVMVVAAIVQVVGYVMYLLFLNGSSKAL